MYHFCFGKMNFNYINVDYCNIFFDKLFMLLL